MDKLTHRFKEGWALLRRPFNFAELDYTIPKLSLVYVYSERPVYKMRIKSEYWKRLNKEEERLLRLPGFLNTGLEDRLQEEFGPTPNEQYETYEGEIVQTLFSGNLTKFYPEEYTVTDIKDYQNRPGFHELYKLRKNDPKYLKQSAIVDMVHYLCSRGMSRQHAELYASSAAKHSVWYEPTEQIQQMFSNINPLKKIA